MQRDGGQMGGIRRGCARSQSRDSFGWCGKRDEDAIILHIAGFCEDDAMQDVCSMFYVVCLWLPTMW